MNQKKLAALPANLQFFVHRLYSAGILTRPGLNGVAATCSISKLPSKISKGFESEKRSRSLVLRSRVSSWTFDIDRKMIGLAFCRVGGCVSRPSSRDLPLHGEHKPPKSIRALAYSHQPPWSRKMNPCGPSNSAKQFPPEPD